MRGAARLGRIGKHRQHLRAKAVWRGKRAGHQAKEFGRSDLEDAAQRLRLAIGAEVGHGGPDCRDAAIVVERGPDLLRTVEGHTAGGAARRHTRLVQPRVSGDSPRWMATSRSRSLRVWGPTSPLPTR